jgi:hypothetical protein
LAPAQPMRPTLPTAPAFLICSRLSVPGHIDPLCLALAPETDHVKHRDYSKPEPKDIRAVVVEGLGSILEECPSIDIYLGKHSSSEKPVPFWHVKPIEKKEDANMELIKVAVTVWASAGIRGPVKDQGVGTMLDSYMNPEATVKVILPVFVNTKRLEFGEQLFYYKPAEPTEERKRKPVEEVDNLAEWVKQRANEGPKKARAKSKASAGS